jgi:hypothetical protein
MIGLLGWINLFRLMADPEYRARVNPRRGLINMLTALGFLCLAAAASYVAGKLHILYPQSAGFSWFIIVVLVLAVLACCVINLRIRHTSDLSKGVGAMAAVSCGIAALAMVPSVTLLDTDRNPISLIGTIVSGEFKVPTGNMSKIESLKFDIRDSQGILTTISIPDEFSARFLRPDAGNVGLGQVRMITNFEDAIDPSVMRAPIEASLSRGKWYQNSSASLSASSVNVAGKNIFTFDEVINSQAKGMRLFSYLSEGFLASAAIMGLLFLYLRKRERAGLAVATAS